MAKGDYVKVKLEIGGQLVEEKVEVTQQGFTLATDRRPRDNVLNVELLNQKGRPVTVFAFAISAVRSVEEHRREE